MQVVGGGPGGPLFAGSLSGFQSLKAQAVE